MTRAFEGRGGGAAGIPREHLAELGVGEHQVLLTRAGLPDKLLESHLEAWSYTPDFTGLVQVLLERLQTERNLSIAVCGAPADSRARAHAALQLSIGLTQHGRSVAVVDADASRPGLAGLIADPHAEGLIDMVRFGRSCRSLLWKPLQTGPAVMPLGSFPVRGRLPFDADAVRGVLHRVALHTDVALYVAPLVEGGELHPIVRACGQAVYVQGPESAARGLDPELAMWVTRGNLTLAGLVFHEPEVADAPVAAPPEVSSLAQSAQPESAAAAGWGPAPPSAPPAAPEPPKFDLTDLEPALDALEPEGDATRSVNAPFATRQARDGARAGAAVRTPDEAREVRDMLRLGETEFAYDDKVSYSRTPLYLLITLVVLIGGFLGWVLWTERGIENRRLLSPRSGTAPGAQVTTPDDAAASGGPAAPVDDAAAAAAAEPQADTGAEAGAGATPGTQTTLDMDLARKPPAATDATANPPQTAGGTTPDPLALPPDRSTPAATTTTEAPPEPTPSRPTTGGVTYGVHVASYQTATRAQSDIDNLQKRGFEARSIRTDLGSKGIWYRVYVGSYPTRAAAEAARQEVLKLPEYSFGQVRRVPTP